MTLPLSPEAEARLVDQRSQYLASMPRKIDCLTLLAETWQRNPENAAAMSAIMAMVHQLCGSAALHRYDALQQAAEQCRDQLESATVMVVDNEDTIIGPLMDEMRCLIKAEPKA
jgi:hypothetical protein